MPPSYLGLFEVALNVLQDEASRRAKLGEHVALVEGFSNKTQGMAVRIRIRVPGSGIRG